MPNEIVIHAGPAKTGTTTIQHALDRFRAELRTSGIEYPDTATSEGQHCLAWDVIDAVGWTSRRWHPSRLSWDGVLASAREAGAPRLLLSSEYFSDFGPGEFAHLRGLLGDRRVTLVFALRDPAALIPSLWQQAIKWGTGDGEEILPLDEAVPVILRRAGVLVRPFLEAARERLAPVTIAVLTVPERPDVGALLRRFADAAGFPDGLASRFAAVEMAVDNESLSGEHCEILLELNRILYARDPSRVRIPTSDHVAARDAILARFAADPRPPRRTIHVGGEARRSVLDLRRQILGWIAQEGVAVHGSLDDLGPTHAELDREATAAAPSPPDTRRRLIEVLADATVSQAKALATTRAAVQWYEEQIRNWETEYRRLEHGLEAETRAAAAIAEARDWHHRESDKWAQEARRAIARHAEALNRVHALARDRGEAAAEIERWRHEAARLGARVDELTAENRRLRAGTERERRGDGA